MIKLHLGCGNKKLKDYTNIDIRELPSVDVVDDIKVLNNFNDNSVDVIYASHVLEHFGRLEYMNVLENWYKKLKDGGVLRIAVPDLEMVMEHYNEHKDIVMLRGFLYGGQTYPQNYHYCGWDFNSIKTDLMSIGFKEVYKYDWTKTDHSDVDDFSQSYLPHMDKKNGKLMSLNIESIK
jgi:predicted SAM-dependent methyltransferase